MRGSCCGGGGAQLGDTVGGWGALERLGVLMRWWGAQLGRFGGSAVVGGAQLGGLGKVGGY